MASALVRVSSTGLLNAFATSSLSLDFVMEATSADVAIVAASSMASFKALGSGFG